MRCNVEKMSVGAYIDGKSWDPWIFGLGCVRGEKAGCRDRDRENEAVDVCICICRWARESCMMLQNQGRGWGMVKYGRLGDAVLRRVRSGYRSLRWGEGSEAGYRRNEFWVLVCLCDILQSPFGCESKGCVDESLG